MRFGAVQRDLWPTALAFALLACGSTKGTTTDRLTDAAASGGNNSSASGGRSATSGGRSATSGGPNSGGAGTPTTDAGTAGTPTADSGAAGTAGSGGHPGGPDASVPKKDSVVVSGTRLKGKYVAGPDGARTYRRGVLFDSQLGVDCTYRKAADGNLRCVPENGLPLPVVMFKDPACVTGGAVWLPAPQAGCTATQPAYVIDLDSAAYCAAVMSEKDLTARVYPVGALLGTVSGTYYRKNATTGACTQSSGQAVDGIPYALGAETPPATLVAGTPSLAP